MMSKPGYKMTELGEIPLEWETYKLGELAAFINGAAFKETDWVLEGLPIIRIQNLNGSNEFNYFQGEIASKFKVAKEDLLFAWSGSRGTSFGPHLWEGAEGVLNQHIFRVEPKDSGQFARLATGTSNSLKNISKEKLLNYAFQLPCRDEQNEMNRILESLERRRNIEEGFISHLERIKQDLMHLLLTGKKRVTP